MRRSRRSKKEEIVRILAQMVLMFLFGMFMLHFVIPIWAEKTSQRVMQPFIEKAERERKAAEEQRARMRDPVREEMREIRGR